MRDGGSLSLGCLVHIFYGCKVFLYRRSQFIGPIALRLLVVLHVHVFSFRGLQDFYLFHVVHLQVF